MAVLKLPTGLKAAQLKQAAFLMGLPTAGTKSELESVILNRLNVPALLPKPTRIVSIDMGIKNLGVCALETTSPVKSAVQSDNQKSKLKVLDWKRLNVLEHLSQQPIAIHGSDQDVPTKARRKRASSPSSTLSPAAFTPSSLSKTALALTKNILENYKPTHILIERQRFRSGGAAAVQEWTLRVNMLESMIWACLETLRSISKSDGLARDVQVHEVSPARVAKFWCLGPLGAGTIVPLGLFNEGRKEGENAKGVETAKAKIEKKDKIAVVRSWLGQNGDRKRDKTVHLDFSDEAREVADSFLSDTEGGRKRKQANGKLDDLADSLLQGAAWVRWEENRQRILSHLT